MLDSFLIPSVAPLSSRWNKDPSTCNAKSFKIWSPFRPEMQPILTNKAVKILKYLCAPPMTLCHSPANPLAHGLLARTLAGKMEPLMAFDTGSPAGIHWAQAPDMDHDSLEKLFHGHLWELQLWQYTTMKTTRSIPHTGC